MSNDDLFARIGLTAIRSHRPSSQGEPPYPGVGGGRFGRADDDRPVDFAPAVVLPPRVLNGKSLPALELPGWVRKYITPAA